MSGEHGDQFTADGYAIRDADGIPILTTASKDDTKRITACLNALDGVATDHLAPGCVAKLVEALELCVDIFGSNASQKHKDKTIEMATAALAAMKGV